MKTNLLSSENSLLINCPNAIGSDREKIFREMLQDAQKYEMSTLYRVTFGKNHPKNLFSILIGNFCNRFNPEQAFDFLDIQDYSQRFLIAEVNEFEVILYVGKAFSHPCLAIFIRIKRDEFFKENISPKYEFGKEIRYDILCYYDLETKSIKSKVSPLLSLQTEVAVGPILSSVKNLILN